MINLPCPEPSRDLTATAFMIPSWERCALHGFGFAFADSPTLFCWNCCRGLNSWNVH
jgi:hypothetical protein